MIYNKVKFIATKENHNYTFEFDDPSCFSYFWAQKVTNGLGYNPIRRENFKEESQTYECLIRHLGEMELKLRDRALIEEKGIVNELCHALIFMDKAYNEVSTTALQALDKINKKVDDII